MIPDALRSNDGLPLPRLQLTWIEHYHHKLNTNWLCKYELLVPLGKHDIRNKRNRGYKAVSLGGTRVQSERGPVLQCGELHVPFRDGAHAKWDSAALGGLPVFVVYGDKVQQMDAALASRSAP